MDFTGHRKESILVKINKCQKVSSEQYTWRRMNRKGGGKVWRVKWQDCNIRRNVTMGLTKKQWDRSWGLKWCKDFSMLLLQVYFWNSKVFRIGTEWWSGRERRRLLWQGQGSGLVAVCCIGTWALLKDFGFY